MGGPAVELAAVKKCCGINVIVSGGVPHFAVLKGAYGSEMSGTCLRRDPVQAHCGHQIFRRRFFGE
jgi:hypothetical protein